MVWVINFLVGFLISAIGVMIPGLINMSAVQMSMRRNFRAGVLFSMGAALTIFLQAVVGVGFAGYLAENREILSFLKKLAIAIFFVLSGVFFYKGLRPKLRAESRRQGHAFVIGMAVAGMNVLNVPFFFTISTLLQAQGYIDLRQTLGTFFMLGLSGGSLTVLVLYAYFARYISTHARFFAQNMNYFLSGLFLFLAVVQWMQLYFA